METLDKHDVEKAETFNGENLDNFIEFEMSDKEQEQKFSNFNELESEGDLEKINSLVEDNHNVIEEKHKISKGEKKRKRNSYIEGELKANSHT